MGRSSTRSICTPERGKERSRSLAKTFRLRQSAPRSARADQLLPVYFSKQELRRFGEAIEIYRGKLFKKEYLPKVKGFTKVRELFERIKRDKKKIALGSSAKQDELKRYKVITEIDDLIETETASDDVENSKPCPIFLRLR